MIRPFSIAGKVAYSGENAGEGIARVAFRAPAIGDISLITSRPDSLLAGIAFPVLLE
jgi:hypothetical protein